MVNPNTEEGLLMKGLMHKLPVKGEVPDCMLVEPFTEEVVTREEAKRRIEEQDEPYKLEILNRIKSEHITIWHTSRNQDGWWDLCAGPHVGTTGDLPKDAIALESIAGAYFFGDENGPMLQRIYGTAWENAEQLAEHQRLQAGTRARTAMRMSAPHTGG